MTPAEPGILRLDTPAGLVVAAYRQVGDYVEAVRFTNVASYLHSSGVKLDCPGLGALTAVLMLVFKDTILSLVASMIPCS